jgi:diguanylate cyclase (GGDEF)-like protein/putative nucleotidyltransferase with HDIG domain
VPSDPRDTRAGELRAETLPAPTVDTPLMAKFAAALFAAGGAMGILTAVLPHDAAMREAGILATSATALLAAAGIHAGRERLTVRSLEALVALGTVLISGAIYFAGAVTTTYAWFYLWVVLYAAYFFGHARAGLQLVLVGLSYALILLTKPSVHGALESWLVAMGTLTMAAVLFGIVRDRVALLLERLGEAATTDTLTGIANRRGFANQFELELERGERSGEPFGLIVGDLDHFKQINDRFGHHAGDEVLEAVARVLSSRARRIDTVARIGGEEFALLLPSTDARGAFMLAETLRAAVRESPRARGLTISFGVTSFPADGRTVTGLLRRADESLYAAKALGRDRAVIYSAEVVGAMSRETGGPVPGSNLATLLTLAEALDIRDPRTSRHSSTVGRYAEAMAVQLGLESARVERVRLAGVLHDIGKIGVADSTLHKPGPLDHDEWVEIRRHPEIGARLLSAPGLEDLRAWVLAHHERLDGRGYPNRIAGEEIPLEARIIAVADAFEAMLSDRPYSDGIPAQDALAELRRHAGTQFDPSVVRALEESYGALASAPGQTG